MKALLVQPMKKPKVIEVESGLAALQKAVHGYIQVVYPFEDPVGLVMNEEGKLEGRPLNRALYDENGAIYDIIAGDFLVVGLTEESFGSLSGDLLKNTLKNMRNRSSSFGLMERFFLFRRRRRVEYE